VLESVLPGYILENWKLLQEKATETVLERGILIPHLERNRILRQRSWRIAVMAYRIPGTP